MIPWKIKLFWFFKELECISKEKDSLKNTLVQKEKISIPIFKVKKNFISIACFTSSSTIDKDIHSLKKSVNCLDSTLSQSATDHKRLEFMFREKYVSYMHAHPSRHTHAHHSHTHDFIHANMYTCTHYKCKGHLIKFCYDRINISLL